jgi:acyl carrier protein
MEDKIVEIISNILRVDKKAVLENMDDYALGKVSSWDSLSHLAIMSEIEQYLENELSIDEMEELNSANKIIKYVLEKNQST